MDYLDDIDQEASNAFAELYDDSTQPKHEMEMCSDLIALLKPQERKDSPMLAVQHKPSRMDYLFKLDGPMTPTILASAGILCTQPQLVTGEGEDGIAQFCKITSSDLPKVKTWLARTYPTFRPVIAPINKARKEFSPFSAYPTLGLDTTLPQHQPHSLAHARHLPEQGQYPVWYFFYGTLADPVFLAELLGLSDDHVPVLVRASFKVVG